MDISLLSDMSLAGYLTLLALIVCSLYMVALGWELRERIRAQALDGEWLLVQIRYLLFSKKTDTATVRLYLEELERPAASICREVLALERPTLETGDYLLSALVERHRLDLERGLAHLGTIAVIAPFVGLFGTVVGITKTFADVAKMGKAGIEVVSAGVAEALVATAVGLLVAIVSVVLFNSFKARIETVVSDWDLTARSLLTLLTGPEEDRNKLLEPRQPVTPDSAQRFLESRSSADATD